MLFSYNLNAMLPLIWPQDQQMKTAALLQSFSIEEEEKNKKRLKNTMTTAQKTT